MLCRVTIEATHNGSLSSLCVCVCMCVCVYQQHLTVQMKARGCCLSSLQKGRKFPSTGAQAAQAAAAAALDEEMRWRALESSRSATTMGAVLDNKAPCSRETLPSLRITWARGAPREGGRSGGGGGGGASRCTADYGRPTQTAICFAFFFFKPTDRCVRRKWNAQFNRAVLSPVTPASASRPLAHVFNKSIMSIVYS